VSARFAVPFLTQNSRIAGQKDSLNCCPSIRLGLKFLIFDWSLGLIHPALFHQFFSGRAQCIFDPRDFNVLPAIDLAHAHLWFRSHLRKT